LDRHLKWIIQKDLGESPGGFRTVSLVIPGELLQDALGGGDICACPWSVLPACPGSGGSRVGLDADWLAKFHGMAEKAHAEYVCISFMCSAKQESKSARRQPLIAGKDRVMRAFAKLISRQGSRENKQKNPRHGVTQRKESSMVINTNTSAESSARLLSESSTALQKSLSKLSSGSKIVSPEDDAAGLAVSTRFDAQINRIAAANTNIGNAISFSQTQDGFLSKVGTALTRMSELALLAQDATKTTADVALYSSEFSKLGEYINDLGSKQFNGVDLFSATGLSVTTDSDATKMDLTAVQIGGLAAYTDATGASFTDAATANTALTNVKAAIVQLASDRANVGANIAVLNSYSSQLGVLKDNISAANSRIKDVDVAQESTQFARYNILVQAGTAMLAQANTSSQSALKLLQ